MQPARRPTHTHTQKKRDENIQKMNDDIKRVRLNDDVERKMK